MFEFKMSKGSRLLITIDNSLCGHGALGKAHYLVDDNKSIRDCMLVYVDSYSNIKDMLGLSDVALKNHILYSSSSIKLYILYNDTDNRPNILNCTKQVIYHEDSVVDSSAYLKDNIADVLTDRILSTIDFDILDEYLENECSETPVAI